jgi:hypothetical protein
MLVVLCTVVLCCNGAVRDLDVAEDHEDDCASHTYADLMMQGRRGSDDIFGRRRSSSKEMNADCTYAPLSHHLVCLIRALAICR